MGVGWGETTEAREMEKSVIVARKIRVNFMMIVLEGRVVVDVWCCYVLI